MGPMPDMMSNQGMMPNQGMMSNFNTPNSNSYMNTWNQDINNRIDKLERKVNRLENRITRLETPYQNTNYNNEPDNNMYMM